MKITILTGYDRNMAELAELCLPSKKAWADRHGVDIHVLRDADYPKEHGHPSFQKLRMDADSVITNPDFDPRDIVMEMGKWPFCVSRDYKAPEEDPRPWWNQWSAGHAVWSDWCDTFDLLDAAMARTEFAWSGLWDQDALQACIGIDGPNHLWRPQIEDTRLMNSVLPGLTGRDEADWQPGDLLCHFTGIRHEDRARVAREFIAANLNPVEI
jgi:hypothetical protein